MRTALFRYTVAGLCVMLAIAMLLGVLLGTQHYPLSALWQSDGLVGRVLWELRLPRVLLVALAGGMLAVSGAAIQSLVRNPLADPGLIGVSGGAALAAVTWQVLAPVPAWQGEGMAVAAFLGGLGVTLLVLRIAQQNRAISTPTLLLAGIAINTLAGAGIALLKYLSDSLTLRHVTFWLMGDVQQARWEHIGLLGLVALGALPWLLRCGKALNAMLLGEAQAQLLGFDVAQVRRQVVWLSALMVGVVVSMVGLIGFVGLIVPHLVRLLGSSDNRVVLPLSFLAGAVLLVMADTLARTLIAPAELPVGLVMSLLGGPFFLALVIYRQRQVALC